MFRYLKYTFVGIPGVGQPGAGIPGVGIPGVGIPGVGISGVGIPFIPPSWGRHECSPRKEKYILLYIIISLSLQNTISV